ncbi:hypothetical protein B484DRAFT_454803 [Ochromonadaceae sp. CCMP2298]|nr:hypothetical protein B484DRAFT_454803 [Ochromonadaceae sp. CCMP2298]
MTKLQRRVVDQNRAFKSAKDQVEREKRRLSRRGLSPGGDHRGNVTRQESLLVNYFHISRTSLTNSAKSSRKEKNMAALQEHQEEEEEEEKERVRAERMPKAVHAPRKRRSFLSKKPKITRDEEQSKSRKKPHPPHLHTRSDSQESFDVNAPKKHSEKVHSERGQSSKKEKGGSHKPPSPGASPGGVYQYPSSPGSKSKKHM